jgi:1-phosphofructokinase
MIYTLTFNPSLDYVVRVEDFVLGNLHRSLHEDIFAGGKGINVSTVLKNLGIDSTVLGLCAGFTGKEILHQLDEMGISSDFVILSQGLSRINIKLKSNTNVESEINGQGPIITQEELDRFFTKLKALREGDILVLSGSVPNSLSDGASIYHNISRMAKESKLLLVIDAEGELLRNSLCEEPFLIKPNLHELEELFHKELTEFDSILACAKALQAEGAKNVLVSLGEKGALLVDEFHQVYRQTAPTGKVLNSVGSGDSMVAGFLAYLLKKVPKDEGYRTEDYRQALKLGVATGSAAAFAIGLPIKDNIEEIYQRMEEPITVTERVSLAEELPRL